MQALFATDGTIRKVYDEALHRHPENIVANLTQEQAENIGLYRVNPTTKEVYLIPTCDEKYIKTIDNVLIEMTAEEKAAVDFAALPSRYKHEVDGVLVEMTTEEKAAVDLDEAKAEKEREINQELREIDIASIRFIREWLTAREDAPFSFSIGVCGPEIHSPHPLKKNGTPAAAQSSRTLRTQSRCIGLAPGPVSPPRMTASIW